MEQRVVENAELNGAAFVVAGWHVDAETLRITKQDQTEKLEPKVMAVLEYLASRQNHVVSRQELEEAVWTGTVVGYDAISNAIIKLRKAFGDDAHNAKVIETIPKVGYRLIAPVTAVAEADTAVPKPHVVVAISELNQVGDQVQIANADNTAARSLPNWKIAFTIGVPLLLLIAVVLLWFKPWIPRVEPASVERMALPLPDKPSIAVLPFINISADAEQEYFVDGMTEDLITDLSKLSGLFVVARNSVFTYKGRAVKVGEVAEELGVRYVLEGSVRRSGNQVRINAQLIDALSGGHVWAERYDGVLDDVFALQDDVTQGIVEQLALNLSLEDGEAIKRTETAYSEAYDLYLKGWGHYRAGSARDYASAIGFFEKSVKADPNLSRAYAAIAAVYWNILAKGWWQESLGIQYYQAFERARISLRRAQKNPTVLTHQIASEWITYFAKASSGPRRAMDEAELALKLDPNHPAGYLAKANALLKQNQALDAERAMRTAMRLDPHFPPEYLIRLAQAQFQLGDYQAAVESLETVSAANPDDGWAQVYLAAAYGQLDILDKARVALTQANRLRAVNGWGPITIVSTSHPNFRWPGKKDALKQGLRVAGAPIGGEWYKLISYANSGAGSEIEGVTTINASEAKALHERGVIFVDTQPTWLAGHIPGAHFLEWSSTEGWLFNEVALKRIAAENQEIVIYAFDVDSKFSILAAALAVSRGFSNIYHFAGGLDAWKAAGYPVELSD